MKRLCYSLTAVLVVFAATAPAAAQEPIRFARTPDISPDGQKVAFSYLGDIYVVQTIGGVARPITSHVAHDVSPVFSPDGSKIAFSSNRHGNYDVFVVSAQGGKPTRLTFDSSQDVVNGWSPDGKYILFSSTRSTAFPHNYELYTVPVTGGRVRRVSAAGGKEGIFSPKGDRIAYVRGPGTWYRKGYRGSSNDDVWVCDADGTHNHQVTTFNGQDTSPMWGAEGKTLYYVSECWGTPANIVRQEVGGKKATLVTFHKEDSVRRARISANGEWIVYECGPDLWVVSTREGNTPRKLAIEVHADEKVNTEKTFTFTRGATEFAPSPDEQHIAFVIRGELFLMPRTGGKATRLTDNPAYDHELTWSPDGKKIIFLSDRDGRQEDFYVLGSDPPDMKLGAAHRFKVRRLTEADGAKGHARYSPDGRRISFIRAGKLWVMNADGTDQKILVDQTQVFDQEWSPDGKYLAFARLNGSLGSEVYLIPSGSGQARNVTRYATFNGDISWSRSAKHLAFISQRRQRYGVWVLDLQKPAAKGAPASSAVDWDDIHLRVHQPSPAGAFSAVISPDGKRVAFRSYGPGGDDLWVAATDGSSQVRITHGNLQPQQIYWSRYLPLLYFLDGEGAMRVARVGFGNEQLAIPFRAKMTIRRDEQFAEMFEQSWRALRDHFYDPKFHGADWNAVRLKYRPLVKHVALKEDLYTLITLMLGELNASHLGISGFLGRPEETTADLGLIFDETYRGPGLKIAEILKRGPADQRGIQVKPGDYVLAIDGTPLTEQTNLSRLLNDKAGEVVLLEVADAPPKADGLGKSSPGAGTVRKVELTAAHRYRVHELMYERWVEHNTRQVERQSGGKLGYIHIPSMDDEGLDRFVRALYSDNFDKEAIVLDVRYNGGGFTHDQVLNYLGAKEHTFFHQRNGGQGLVLRSYDRKWTRPLVLLINNRSFSDAEIFPSAFRTLGLGKLVGQPTGGFVIGTTGFHLIDGSTLRLPMTGVYTATGVNMEGKGGVTPDYAVEEHPDQLARGEDPQLARAVEVLRSDVIAWKKKRKELVKKGTVKTAQPASAPVPGPGGKPLVGTGKR
jgi:tricorn protease